MKKWIIRTRSNHILGPVSQEKILELIENNSIHSDDEICSANGYWFQVKEADLLKKYLYEGNEQGFNPVSEALLEMRNRMGGDNKITPKEITQVISVKTLDNDNPSNEDQ